MTRRARETEPGLRLFLTIDHPCGYLPGRSARNLIADPEEVDQSLYNRLSKLGFRRSGGYVYRPECDHCRACRSLRVNAEAFTPNRSQRRNLRINADLRIRLVAPRFDAAHYQLFSRYLASRHAGGGMDRTSPEQYMGFVDSIWSHTRFAEFRDADNRLLALAVMDRLDDGLSAVYTCFDPDHPVRGLGTYVILWQIEHAREEGVPWVYLGYWVHGSAKMDYKVRFRPAQAFNGERWADLIVD